MEHLQPLYGEGFSPEQAFSSLSQSNTHQESPVEHCQTVTGERAAVLSPLHCQQQHLNPQQTHAEVRKELTDAPLPGRMGDLRENVLLLPETSAAAPQMKLVGTSQTSRPVHLLTQLHEELEESHQGFQPTSEDPGPSVSSNTLRASSSAHVNNICHPPNLLHFPTQNPASPSLNVKPVALFADMNPSFHAPRLYPHITPRFNPAWPVLVPHFSPNVLSNASAPRHNPFCPIHTPQLNVSLRFKASFSALVARAPPHMPQPTRTDGEAQDSFRLWQRLSETARLFCSSASDAEALACFFTRVIHRPGLPFIAAVNAAVQEWKNISVSERQPYYNTARMFSEMEKQGKSANRAEDHPTIPQTDKHKGRRSGKVKKAGKRSKKGIQDLAEGALAEYSQLMDALGSKVSDGSEVTAAEEEDVCGPFLDQLLDNTTEAGFDMDYISSLLSSDDSQDTLSSMIPEPVAGCSDWTRTAVSGAPSAVQHDFSSSEATNHTMENVLVPFRDNINGQNVFRTSTQPLLANPAAQSSQTDPNASVQETAHPDLQDFGLEADGNQKDEASYVSELDCATQSNGLQNYNSHHATFPRAIKHDPEAPKPPVDDRVEHRGEKNMEVGQKTQKCMYVGRAKDNNNMDSDPPNDSQRTRRVCTKQTLPNKTEENNVHKNRKHKRRWKQQKMTLPVARRLKTAENPHGKTQRKSATKREARAQETDFCRKACPRLRRRDQTFQKRWTK